MYTEFQWLACFKRSMDMFTDEHLGPEVEAVVQQLLA